MVQHPPLIAAISSLDRYRVLHPVRGSRHHRGLPGLRSGLHCAAARNSRGRIQGSYRDHRRGARRPIRANGPPISTCRSSPAILRPCASHAASGDVRAAHRRSSSIPVSLEVLGTREGVRTPVSDLMHGLHGSFSLGGRTGRPIVGWMGVGMTFLGISGLILWWPRKGAWKNSIGVRKNARGSVWHRQLHADCRRVSAGSPLWWSVSRAWRFRFRKRPRLLPRLVRR